MAFSDKLKALKALADSEKREQIMAAVIVQAKAKKAQEATAVCIAEGLGEPREITELKISAGAQGLLPLSVTVTADGKTTAVESIQPEGVDFDYAVLVADFNGVAAENPDITAEFLQKTAALLNSIIADNDVGAPGFETQIY